MAMEKLCAQNVEGGRALEVLNQELDRIVGDVVERKFLGEARKVTLEITVKPKIEGEVNMPVINWQVKWSMPGRAGIETRAFEEHGELQVNPNKFADPRQGSLLDVPGVSPANVTPMRAEG